MYRLLLMALVAILAGLQYQLWVGEGSYAQVHRLRIKLADLRADNAAKKQVNEDLRAQINVLKSGSAAAERLARTRLGLVGENEQFFLTPKPKKSDGAE